MEAILNEYKLFLQGIIDDHSTLTSGSTLSGMRERVKQLQTFVEEYDRKATDKANEYLQSIDGEDSEFKDKLVATAKEYFNSYTREHFPWTNPI